MSNPRYPHTCKVYRLTDESPFGDTGTETVLYEGECRKEGNTSLRTFKTDGVVKGDYRMSIPGTVGGILSGDLVDVTDRQGTFRGCMVTDSYAGNLGTTIYFNLPKN